MPQDPNNLLHWLQQWYADQCNGEWEHDWGVTIGTLDNPGWSVKIDLRDTALATKPFPAQQRQTAEHDWLHCTVQDQVFAGYGDAGKLITILEIFRNFALSHNNTSEDQGGQAHR